MLSCPACGKLFEEYKARARYSILGDEPGEEDTEIQCPSCRRYQVKDWYVWQPSPAEPANDDPDGYGDLPDAEIERKDDKPWSRH